jgi:peptide/nickel transport system substrate-binding protein
MIRNRRSKLLAAGLAAAFIVAACGSDDGGSDSTDGEGTEAPVETEAPDDGETEESTDGETETEDTTAEGAEEESEGGDTDEGVEAEGDVDTEVVADDTVQTYGGDAIVGLEAETTGLRPWEDACSAPCYNMMRAVYDSFLEQREDGTYGPWLATDIAPNDDLTEWTMTLPEGVMFHNGTPLTASTVEAMFPIQQAGSAGAGAVSASGLVGVTAVDDTTVLYTLGAPNSAFDAYLNLAPLGMPFDPEAAAADPDGYSMAPIGTGPFVIESRDVDNATKFVRNEDYWAVDETGQSLPYLDSVEFRPIPDEGTRLDSLLSGTTNGMQTLRQGTIRDARDAAGDSYNLYEHQGNDVGGGMFNVTVPPYDDVRVRLGLTQMNNQEAVIEALGGTGISLPGTQWFSPDSPWWSADVAEAWPKFDYEAGQATLQEYIDDPARSDGKAPGESIDVDLSCPPDPTLIAAMQVLEQLWSQSGLVNVSLTQFDQQTHINNALGAPPDFAGSHGAHCWRWSSEADPSTYLGTNFSPPTPEIAVSAGLEETAASPLNFHNYFSDEMWANLQAAVGTTDFDERYALYEAVMMEIVEQVMLWYSGHTASMIATDSDIVGLNTWALSDGTLGIGHPNAVGRWSQASMDG